MTRFDGMLKTWNDERGFGFLQPALGGQEIFVHIKAFKALSHRPQQGQWYSFAVEVGAKGKKQARDVLPLQAQASAVQGARPRHAARGERALRRPHAVAQWGTATLFVLPLFLLLLLAAYLLGKPPRWCAPAYLLMSGVTFGAYLLDKAAAQAGRLLSSPLGRLLHAG